MIADYMFWGEMTYKDSANIPVPRVTYRCKSRNRDPEKKGCVCKIVTDHAGGHLCICGEDWT
jgi:hypothetical protein